MDYALLPFRRYFEFSGRSRRKEYWLWSLFTFVVSSVLTVVDRTLGWGSGGSGGGLLAGVFGLITFVPGLAVLVRRLHDTDRSAWWLLSPFAGAAAGLILVPIAGVIGVVFTGIAIAGTLLGLLVFLCQGGTSGANRFGSDPKDEAGVADLEEVFR